jgi:hypothetical protein
MRSQEVILIKMTEGLVGLACSHRCPVPKTPSRVYVEPSKRTFFTDFGSSVGSGLDYHRIVGIFGRYYAGNLDETTKADDVRDRTLSDSGH